MLHICTKSAGAVAKQFCQSRYTVMNSAPNRDTAAMIDSEIVTDLAVALNLLNMLHSLLGKLVEGVV